VRLGIRSLTCIVTLALAVAFPHAEPAPTYAIRGARLVTVSGPPVEAGTIVIRRGVIQSVGASVPIPPGAEIMDGTGLTVYPGLIDLGNPRATQQPEPKQPQNLKTTGEVERWKRVQILRPQARAVDALKADATDLGRLASAGITTVLALPSGEVVSGQSALVDVVAPPDEPQIGNIVGDGRELTIIKAPVAIHVEFAEHPRAAPAAYPESLMGVIAFVRQAFLDAQHYALEEAHYERVKVGEQPADPVLEAMQPALERKEPVAFEANEAREILRALKMAAEFHLDPIITGALEAPLVADDLKSAGARVVYSLAFPQRPKNLAPDADEPLRVLRDRADAAGMPARLAQAGITFAFESAGLSDPNDFVKNASKAVKAGLSADAAVRALTLGAATIAGASARVGSLDTGKVANLVVTKGNLFDDGAKIVRVFVEGRPVALQSSAERPSHSSPRDAVR